MVLALPPDEGCALADTLVAECSNVESCVARWPLMVAWCDRLLALGDHDGAAGKARLVWSAMGRSVMPTMYHPQAWWIVGRAFDAAGCDAEAAQAYACALSWIRRALPHVPPAFRESFLRDNPYNARLLTRCGDGFLLATAPHDGERVNAGITACL